MKLPRNWIVCDKRDDKHHFKCMLKTNIEAFRLDEDDIDEAPFFCHNCATLNKDDDDN